MASSEVPLRNGKLDFEILALSLPDNATMRDIFDFCVKYNLHNLAQGMIELPPPKKLREIAAAFCLERNEIHQYRNRFGEDDYRDALVKFVERQYGTKIGKESILATSGVSGTIVSTLMMLKNERRVKNQHNIHSDNGVRVGLLVPFYTYHFKQITDILGEQPVFISTNEDFTPNFEIIENHLQRGLDLILITNPGNPQGNVWSAENIRHIVKLTAQYKCLLLMDEIYCDLVWRGKFFSPIDDQLYEHVIVGRGFSKTLGCQSWRCGFCITAPKMAEKIMRIHDPIYISVPWQQHAISTYLNDHFDDFKKHVQETGELMQSNWRLLSKAMQSKFGWEPIEPDGSMYGMFKHHAKSDRDAVLVGLKHGVGVAPGKIFFPGNMENTSYVRIHCGITSEKAIAITNTIEATEQ